MNYRSAIAKNCMVCVFFFEKIGHKLNWKYFVITHHMTYIKIPDLRKYLLD